jgi:hypothetical protein
MENDTAKITILDNDYVSVWVYPDKKMIHHEFHKFVYGEILREALNAGTDAMKKYGAHKWLSDDRRNSALPREDQDWGNTVWFPQTKAVGWKYWAIVKPESVIGQLNIKRLAGNVAEEGVVTKFFSYPDEAMAWLESQ